MSARPVFYYRTSGAKAERAFPPLDAEHPAVGTLCAACDRLFEAGEQTALVPLGPGVDPEAQEKARRGSFYNGVAVLVHAACAGVSDPREADSHPEGATEKETGG